MNVETNDRWETRNGDALLQWGHVQVNVETARMIGEDTSTKQKLQWGHVQVNVETEAQRIELVAIHKLQWGHVQVNVETS